MFRSKISSRGTVPLVFSAIFLLLVTVSSSSSSNSSPPDWSELDQRALPTWYDEAKFGIFIHWGLFSVPAFKTEWFWEYWHGWHWQDFDDFIARTEAPDFVYQDYAQRFRAEFYNPHAWAQLFADAGAQYVVFTSKHHEGFCMWNSTEIPTTYGWNSVDVGPQRDLLGELASEVKKVISPHTNTPLQFGLYHSLYEWFNPLYLQDKANNFATQDFVTEKATKELYDLVTRYEPNIIWSDGEWETTSDYWKAREFLHWLSTESAVKDTVVWNDRWGNDTLCKHGGFLTCTDRYQPDSLKETKWEDALTIDKTSWGYNRNASISDYLTAKELIVNLAQVVSKNGNMLLNVGPAADGTIHPIFADRLLSLGKWLKVNGESIYKSRPWKVCQNETDIFYTTSADQKQLFVIFTKWPVQSLLRLQCPVPTKDTTVRMLGLQAERSYRHNQTSIHYHALDNQLSGMDIMLPPLTPDMIPCEHAWVLSIANLANLPLL